MGNRTEKGFTIMLGTISLVVIVPMIGLAIDVGFLYAVQSKLQAAVDGAALAAARSLNIGSSTAAQQTSAQNNATNWFNANFPAVFGTHSTAVATPTVADDPNNPHLRNVTVTATTQVNTFFMRWFGVTATTVGATGTASRRDVVAMIVLDRSGSMCMSGGVQHSPCTEAQTTYPCSQMINAAKIFTGQFAAGRDQIGLISFSDNAYLHETPKNTFQTDLGYTNDSGTGSGALDNISCDGGTSTAEGIAMAYQTLYQTNLQGALNIIVLETDGLPNTLAMNFYDSANSKVGLKATSTCVDNEALPKTLAAGGFANATQIPNWTAGLSLTTAPFLTSAGYYSTIPPGMVGAVASQDPGQGNNFFLMINYWTTGGQGQSLGTAGDPYNSSSYLSTAPGCAFNGGGQVTTNPTDIAWFPATDVFGNQLNPSSYTYQSVTTDAQGHITQNGWSNFHNAVLNATDNAAYQARANGTLPAYFFAIGLGGNSAVPPDPVLLQRIANDPNGDTFNSPATYSTCASETNCTTYTTQPQGTFIYSPNSSYLAQAFLRISSQVLRLSK